MLDLIALWFYFFIALLGFAILALLFIAPIIAVIVIPIVLFNKKYKESTYYKSTKLPYFAVRYNKGRYGEYLTYKNLEFFESMGAKFLFNVYIPKQNGQTTECDIIMLCHKGIFVFESKNYEGWIFGNESQKNWYQILPTGKGRSHKQPFYNPIMQNRSHTKHLKSFLNKEIPIWSVIVFSDRCTFKNIRIQSPDVYVIHRSNVTNTVTNVVNNIEEHCLSDEDVLQIYNKLYPFSQVSSAVKSTHIANIERNTKPKIYEKKVELSAVTDTEQTVNSESVVSNPPEENSENLCVKQKESPQILYCPKCKGQLVLRTTSRGSNIGNKFWGCSNYPKCRYMKKL